MINELSLNDLNEFQVNILCMGINHISQYDYGLYMAANSKLLQKFYRELMLELAPLINHPDRNIRVNVPPHSKVIIHTDHAYMKVLDHEGIDYKNEHEKYPNVNK